MTTVSLDCRLRPRPAARMLSRKMKAGESGALKRWMALSLRGRSGECVTVCRGVGGGR
jgi:hypothetical protein